MDNVVPLFARFQGDVIFKAEFCHGRLYSSAWIVLVESDHAVMFMFRISVGKIASLSDANLCGAFLRPRSQDFRLPTCLMASLSCSRCHSAYTLAFIDLKHASALYHIITYRERPIQDLQPMSDDRCCYGNIHRCRYRCGLPGSPTDS